MRTILSLVVIAGLQTSLVAANEGGGDGGNDLGGNQQGGSAKTKKKANCDKFVQVKQALDDRKEEVAKARKGLAKARDELEDAKQSTAPGQRDRVKKAENRVYLATFALKQWMDLRDLSQRSYDRLRPIC